MPGTTALEILLVEDEKAHIELIQRAFLSCPEKVAFQVAHTLKDASCHLAERRFDLVLLDFLLPDGKGMELLPADKEEAHCPYMLMTSHGDEKLAVDALKAGALDYVVKSAENLANMPLLVQRALREWTLIKERRKAEDALRISEEKFRTIADYSTDLGIWLDVDGQLLWASRAVEKLTGYTLQECLDQPAHLLDSIHPDDQKKVRLALARSLAKKTSENNLSFRLQRKDGALRWFSSSWQPLFNTHQEFLGLRASTRDIHELQCALEKLEEANRELDAFVYTVSHDLRTPLTPIMGYAQILKKQYGKSLDEKGQQYLSIIAHQSENMLNLLEDLLQLARAGFLARPQAPVNTAATVREVVYSLSDLIKGIDIDIDESSLPAVRLPRTLLAQAFENLIKNAVIHAGEQGAPIEVGGTRRDGRACFYVRDHGPGIPNNEKCQIFEVFFRGEYASQTQGSGVGLATVRKIARQYGGRAWAEDTPQGGATFWLSVEDVPEASS